MSAKKNLNYVLKLVLLGDTAVGKTSLVHKYAEDRFKEDYKATLGTNIVMKNIEIEQIESKVRLILWDIAGQDKYEKSRHAYYEGCAGALFIYDITRYSSFENIEFKWLKDYKKYVKDKDSYILIGNKNDLENQRGVYKEDATKLAKRINAIDFIETSAKLGDNVENAFLKLVRQILSNYGVKFEEN